MTTLLRRCGLGAIAGAALAILGNAFLFVVNPAVPDDRLSYPLSPQAYVPMQLFLALTQALLAAGVVGLVCSDVVRPSRAARILGGLAVVGMLLTVPGELVLILVRRAAGDASSVGTASSVFGLGALLADIGLTGIGVIALRQRRWPRPWAALPLVLGIFQLFVVTPVSIAFGFAGVASNVVIGIADVLTALIGVAVIRLSSPAGQVSRTGARSVDA
ncbi:MAG: hypothetical protein DLM61_13480 [Pseudonocardiales bacterium]|nr:MAG: hypothetical protein DLM61_13480 [Pseudonocardiales bacterium]